jgi:hypothetical protein
MNIGREMNGGSMEEEMEDFWKYFIVLVAGSVIAFVGAWIGKTVAGYLLYGLGLAAVVAVFVFLFVKKKYFTGDRRKVLILGLTLSVLLAASSVMIIDDGGSRLGSTNSRSSVFSQLSRMTGGSSASSQYRNFGSSGNFSARAGTNGTNSNRFGNGFSGQGGYGTGGSYSGRYSSGTTGTTTTTAQTTAQRNFILRRMIITLIGWILLGIGTILLIVVVIRLLTKKTSYKGDRWKVLLLGLLVGTFIASSTAFLLTRSASASFSRQGMNSQMLMRTPGAGQNGTGLPGAQMTATATETATPTPLPVPTSTPRPTATATVQVYQSLVVCLDYNIQIGTNIRNFPSADAATVGSIPPAGCFTIDGKNSAYAGWYHLAAGQNGLGSIVIRGDPNATDLWVNSMNFDKSNINLNQLPEVAVTPTK